MPGVRVVVVTACTFWLLAAVACGNSPSSPTGPGGGTGTPPPNGRTVTVIGAADIGMCGSPGVAGTARLVAGIPGELLIAGDIAYLHGTAANFRDCFDPSWGQFRSRWHPVPGNHEYESPGAAPYFAYFGEAAAPDGLSYYALNLGEWLVLMIDSNIPANRGSPQWEFVRQHLQNQRTPCTMAVWHHPLFSSGPNGPSPHMGDVWGLLETAGAEVVLNGHDHLYERFARQTSTGRAEPARGIRQFTLGTGGAELYGFVRSSPNSEVRISQFGVLRLTLRPAQVDWVYLGANGATLDSGLDTCR